MFATINPTTLPNKSATVKNVRRDGKLTVEFFFPVSGRHITKILTPEATRALADQGYDLFGLR